MEIYCTKHARGRITLFDITEADVEKVIKKSPPAEMATDKIESIASLRKFKYPLKVVYRIVKRKYIIITAYPLKRGLT
jgi:hypothetical protein